MPLTDPLPRLSSLLPLLLLAPLASWACTPGDSATAGAWEASVDTIADTVVVRTVSGSEWPDTMTLVPEVEIGVLEGAEEYMFGNIGSMAVDPAGRIWALDRHVPEIRVFDASGEHEMTVGRPGEGPGELQSPDGGMAVLSDGRVLVRDPANTRIQLYSPEGEPAGTWPLRGGFSTSDPLWTDREDRVYTQVLMDAEASLDEWRMGLARYEPDGTVTDTLPVPDAGWEAPFVEARTENSWSRSPVPFTAGEDWGFHPEGYFVHGIGDAYSFTLLKEDEEALPVRIERRWDPVPVQPGEADEARRRTTRNMRGMVPDWSWNGGAVPSTKPAFRNLMVGGDGRIWVQVSAPGYERDDPDHDPTDPESVPNRWREPIAFDVFEPDGTYLGHVRTPEGFGIWPTPIMEGEHVWAVTTDDLGVDRIARFRLTPVDRP